MARATVEQDFLEIDNVGMGGQLSEGPYLPQVVNLVIVPIDAFHALDGVIIATVDVLSLYHLAEGSFALLGNQFVFLHGGKHG